MLFRFSYSHFFLTWNDKILQYIISLLESEYHIKKI